MFTSIHYQLIILSISRLIIVYLLSCESIFFYSLIGFQFVYFDLEYIRRVIKLSHGNVFFMMVSTFLLHKLNCTFITLSCSLHMYTSRKIEINVFKCEIFHEKVKILFQNYLHLVYTWTQ